MKKLLLTLFLSALLLPSQADEMVVDGLTRNYLVYAPQNLGDKRPLLISCHGMNQDAAYQKNMLDIASVADTAKFVTVFPNGIGNADGSNRGWDIGGNRDINFVLAIIDKMVEQYHIDPKRVYLSGFSMGGMFTYHAMNRIPDKIAAFAPISGYPMGGTTANANVRPIPIIHTHGTSDDVVNFGGVQGSLNAWINHNGCPTKATVVSNYRGASHITRHTWGPGENGVEVVLMELANKGHWISNDIIKTGEEIWKFCSRYSLDLKDPSVRITSPTNSFTFLGFGGASEVPNIPVKATASDPDGQLVKVSFYDNDELKQELTAAPYNYTYEGLGKGEHRLRVVATDDEGRTGAAVRLVNVEEPTENINYLLQKTFTSEGSVPDGWVTNDGNEKRTGFSSGYSSGSRLFRLTGEKHDFEYGLYTRNVNGTAKAGYASFAAVGTTTKLTLYPGNYQLMCRVANWNRPAFSPVTIAIETTSGQTIASETFTPTSNVGNAANSSFTGTTIHTMNFEVKEKNRCQVTFYTADDAWADLVIGAAALKYKGAFAAIETPSETKLARTIYYNMAGQRVGTNVRGLQVAKSVLSDGTVKSRIVITKKIKEQ